MFETHWGFPSTEALTRFTMHLDYPGRHWRFASQFLLEISRRHSFILRDTKEYIVWKKHIHICISSICKMFMNNIKKKPTASLSRYTWHNFLQLQVSTNDMCFLWSASWLLKCTKKHLKFELELLTGTYKWPFKWILVVIFTYVNGWFWWLNTINVPCEEYPIRCFIKNLPD